MGIQYPTSQDEADGTHSITGVPIFKLDEEKRGFYYGQDWGDRAVAAFDDITKDGYLPPLIRGHNWYGEERPAEGFIQNLKRDESTLTADFVKIPADLFAEMEDRKWPYRSVEIDQSSAELMAVALLGSNAPYDKLPLLAFKQGEGETLIFSQSEVGVWHNTDDKGITTEEINVAENITPEVVTPEQFAAQTAIIETMRTDLTTANTAIAEEKARADKAEQKFDAGNTEIRGLQVTAFGNTMKSLGFSPAFIESTEVVGATALFGSETVVKFGETDHTGLDGATAFFSAIAKAATDGTLMVPKGEVSGGTSDTGLPVDADDEEARVAQANKFAAEKGTSFSVEYKQLLPKEG